MNDLFAEALGLNAPWFIESITFDAEHKRLDIHVDFQRGARFHFSDTEADIDGDYPAYDTVEKTWRHLNFFEHECYLHAFVPRLDTPVGKRLLSPPWAGRVAGFTMLFEALLVQLATHMPVHALSRMTNVSDYKLWLLLERYVDAAREHLDCSDLTDIGVDETSLKRGHNYMTLVVDLKPKRTLYVTEGRDASTIERFAADLTQHNGSVESIDNVSADMSPAFAKGVTAHLPNAALTFDRFHVLKLVNEAVDAVRRWEARSNPLLKKKRYLFLKNWENLSEDQQRELEALELPSRKLKTVRALHLRESFQDIYEADTPAEFEALLKKWYRWATHARLEPFTKLAATIKKHWDGIVRYKRSKITNGILEGFNSIVQAAKRKARGYRLPKTFAIMVYLLTGKLDFSRVNRHILPT